MVGRIFINYRRGDDPGFTGWLRERLEDVFAADHLFMDVDSIAPGLDFVSVLEDQVDKCDVFLAVIGPRWLDARDETGNRRLDNPDDFVRIEIESGLKLGKRIIPVLVNNADMPRAEHLPAGLKPLARRNAVRLTHERFKADAQGLIKALEKALEEVEADRQHTVEAKALRDTLKAEADAVVAEEERRKREREAWAMASAADNQEAYATFLKAWPGSQHTRAGRSRLKKLAAAAPAAGATKRGKWLAAVFAVLVLPCQLFLGLLFTGWNWGEAASDKEGGVATGLVVALAIAVSSAAALAYWRRATLSGAEIVFYWLGCTLASIYAVLFVFGMNEWNWVGAANAKDGGAATGLVVGLAIAMSSAAALVYWRRATTKNDHSSIEARRL